MKIAHFLALLKNDSRMVWPMIFLAVFYTYLSGKEFRQDQMFELAPFGGSGVFLFLLPYLMGNFLFQNDGFYGKKMANASNIYNLEFMFTRAIDRTSLFGAKASLYLILCSTPLVAIWAYSFTAPTVRVELPYYPQQHREEMKQFYLSHYEGSYLEESDNGRNKDYVVLPQGRPNQSMCTFVFTFAATLVFQAAIFAFARLRWIPLVTFFLLMILLPWVGISRKTPSLYESFVAWVPSHAFLVFLGLSLLTLLTQLYCCRRFVNTEVTS